MPVYAVLIVPALSGGALFRVPDRRAADTHVPACHDRSALRGTVGYVVIFIVVYDYSRWVSSWAVCMFLMLHATRLLPSTFPHDTAPINPRDKLNVVLGWIVTAIPRVGVTIPF